jgi:uncharacterized protein YjbI with pentapeptide repeats
MVDTPQHSAPASRGPWLMVIAAAVGLIALALLIWQVRLLQEQQQALRATTREHLFWTLCQPATPVEERTRAFTRLAADGHSEWRSAATQGLNLRGSRLVRAELKLADLAACDLREALLIEADLTGVSLRTADLSKADLTEATLDGAECLKAKLDGAHFHKALLRSVSLEQVSAVGTHFVLADLSDALLLMADLTRADLTGANLSGATLEAANLRGATLGLANLAQANLTNADLTDTNWWRARGLTREQLISFAAEFPPTPEGDPSRLQDYLLWADKFGATPAGTSQSSPDTPESTASQREARRAARGGRGTNSDE